MKDDVNGTKIGVDNQQKWRNIITVEHDTHKFNSNQKTYNLQSRYNNVAYL